MCCDAGFAVAEFPVAQRGHREPEACRKLPKQHGPAVLMSRLQQGNVCLQLVPRRGQFAPVADQQARCLQRRNVLVHVFVITPQRLRQLSDIVGPTLAHVALQLQAPG